MISPHPAQSVLVIGAGIGGLTCALALLKKGFKVTVLEQAPVITEIGAGLQISPNATVVLDALGVGDALRENAFAPRGIQAHQWKSGVPLARVDFDRLDFSSPYLHLHRADLQGLLLQAVRANPLCSVRTGARVMAVQCSGAQGRVMLANGEWLAADWLIGADGIHSHTRDYVTGIPQPPRFTGNVAWRGVLDTHDISDSLLPPPYANIWMGPGAHVVMYYLRDRQLLNFVAVTESDEWRDESWTQRASLKDMLQDFADWDPRLFDLLARSDPGSCYRWALFDRTPPPVWGRERVLLLGDAVHPMLPFVAQGAAMAIEDAWVLAESLASGQGSATVIRRYTDARLARVTRVQQYARDNMQLFHLRNPLLRGLRDVGATALAKVSPQLAARKVSWIYQYAPTDQQI